MSPKGFTGIQTIADAVDAVNNSRDGEGRRFEIGARQVFSHPVGAPAQDPDVQGSPLQVAGRNR